MTRLELFNKIDDLIQELPKMVACSEITKYTYRETIERLADARTFVMANSDNDEITRHRIIYTQRDSSFDWTGGDSIEN